MTAPDKRPNIVLIHTHDMGRYLNAYGYSVETPHTNQLAASGAVFTNYHSTAPQCSPSRASLMTGLHPQRNGMLGLAHLGWHIHEGIKTLPVLLRDHGYHSLLFGTQHEAKDGLDLGYELTEATKMPQLATDVTDSFLSYLDRHGESNERQPFFASVGFWEAHRPFDAPHYAPDDPNEVEVPTFLLSTPGVRTEISQLHGMIKTIDAQVERIIRGLDVHDLTEDTLLIFTTDHGIAFPRAKGTLYDTGTGITLMIQQLGRIRAGSRHDHLLSNVDLLPTILDLVGAPTPEGLDGKSFAGLLVNRTYEPRERIYNGLTWHDRYSPVRGIRTQRYKYIKHFADGPEVYLPVDVHKSLSGQDVRSSYYAQKHALEELYDLQEDPLEQSNLASDRNYQRRLDEMRRALKAWMKEIRDPLLEGPVEGIESPGWAHERQTSKLPF